MTPIELPLRLVSTLNERVHWTQRARRAHSHRAIARMRLTIPLLPFREQLYSIATTKPLIAVRITRVGKRLLDSDNLAASAKHIRDGIADALGIDDADPRVAWEYDQRIGEYAVTVDVLPIANPHESERRIEAGDMSTRARPPKIVSRLKRASSPKRV